MIPATFSDMLALLPLPLLCAYPLPSPTSSLPLFPFLLQITSILLFPTPLSCSPPPPWSPFTFLVSAVNSSYMLTSEELDLGASNGEHSAFVFLD